MSIPCPIAGCSYKFTDSDIGELAPLEVAERYRIFKENIQIDLDPSLKWCPAPDCRTAISKTTKICSKCQTKICFVCGRPDHKGLTCDDAEDLDYREWAKAEGDVVNCKMCKARITKIPDEGCNHMTCPKCQY